MHFFEFVELRSGRRFLRDGAPGRAHANNDEQDCAR
jgi:hypothetical protein